ncbi:MAG: hypothetical protein M1812_002059 [Candelaria pacifica]|nr:MAG: hypothetical protein M1812_002059 [Candelaria pacifica]
MSTSWDGVSELSVMEIMDIIDSQEMDNAQHDPDGSRRTGPQLTSPINHPEAAPMDFMFPPNDRRQNRDFQRLRTQMMRSRHLGNSQRGPDGWRVEGPSQPFAGPAGSRRIRSHRAPNPHHMHRARQGLRLRTSHNVPLRSEVLAQRDRARVAELRQEIEDARREGVSQIYLEELDEAIAQIRTDAERRELDLQELDAQRYLRRQRSEHSSVPPEPDWDLTYEENAEIEQEQAAERRREREDQQTFEEAERWNSLLDQLQTTTIEIRPAPLVPPYSDRLPLPLRPQPMRGQMVLDRVGRQLERELRGNDQDRINELTTTLTDLRSNLIEGITAWTLEQEQVLEQERVFEQEREQERAFASVPDFEDEEDEEEEVDEGPEWFQRFRNGVGTEYYRSWSFAQLQAYYKSAMTNRAKAVEQRRMPVSECAKFTRLIHNILNSYRPGQPSQVITDIEERDALGRGGNGMSSEGLLRYFRVNEERALQAGGPTMAALWKEHSDTLRARLLEPRRILRMPRRRNRTPSVEGVLPGNTVDVPPQVNAVPATSERQQAMTGTEAPPAVPDRALDFESWLRSEARNASQDPAQSVGIRIRGTAHQQATEAPPAEQESALDSQRRTRETHIQWWDGPQSANIGIGGTGHQQQTGNDSHDPSQSTLIPVRGTADPTFILVRGAADQQGMTETGNESHDPSPSTLIRLRPTADQQATAMTETEVPPPEEESPSEYLSRWARENGRETPEMPDHVPEWILNYSNTRRARRDENSD